MTKKELEKLCRNINKEFSVPFLATNVEAKMHKDGKGFNLEIDGRDVSFDSDLNVTGAGTRFVEE